MGENPYEPPPPGTVAPGRPQPPPPGWGYSGPGWDPPPADLTDPGRGRRRSAVWLGVVSLVLAVAGLVAVVIGGVTLLFGIGIFFLLVGVLVWLVAVGLAVASVVATVRAGGGHAVRRALAVLPAVATLALVGLTVGSFVDEQVASRERREQPPAPRPRPLAASVSPVTVVETVGDLAFSIESEDICLLLAERARGPRCEDRSFVGLRAEDARLVRASATRALVSYAGRYEPGGAPRRRVRLVREAGGWQLLDLPSGRDDTCVDTARDPWSCPVEVVGA